MIQRACSRQARAIYSSSNARLSSTLAASRRPAALQPISQSLRPLPPRIARRWVTTDAEEKTLPAEETVKPAPGEVPSASAENPLQKELETKNREIIDLKVRLVHCSAPDTPLCNLLVHPMLYFYTDNHPRTDISAPSPTSATSKSAPSARSPPQNPSLSNASPPTSSTQLTTSTAPSPPCPLNPSKPAPTPPTPPSPPLLKMPSPPRPTKISSTCIPASR